MSNIEKIANEWEEMGKKDPKWGALTTPGKAAQWGDKEFLDTGVSEINLVLDWLEENSIKVDTKGRALDFGCGPGRLTLALSTFFSESIGLDVSPSMLKEAERLAAGHPGEFQFLLSEPESIEVIGQKKFKLIYSNHVLQHIPQNSAKKIIGQLCQALDDDGVLVLKVPYKRRFTVGKLIDMVTPLRLEDFFYKLRFGDLPRMRMHAISIAKMEKICTESGSMVKLKKFPDAFERWQSCIYAITKIR